MKRFLSALTVMFGFFYFFHVLGSGNTYGPFNTLSDCEAWGRSWNAAGYCMGEFYNYP